MSETTGTPGSRRSRAAVPAPSPAEVPSAVTPDNTSVGKTGFQQEQYLEERDGMPYLPLKWRLSWLRSEHSSAKIKTRLVSHTDGLAVFKAEIELPEGGSATGWGAKLASDYSSRGADPLGYLRDAENQALSRALAALGYGTQYAYDFDPPADTPPIELPETEFTADEERGIEVPLNLPVASLQTPDDDDEPDDDEDDEDESEEDQIRFVPRGEVRMLNERRPPLEIRPPEPTPLRERPAQPEPRPMSPLRERPPVPAEPTVAPPPAIGNQSVDDRLKNVRDEELRLQIRQIYYEARRNFNYDEDVVDQRSVQRYRKPTYELDAVQANEFYERIVAAARSRGQNQ